MKNRSVLFEYVKRNKLEYITVIVFLILGIIAGILFINNADSEKVNEIINNVSYIEELIKQQNEIDKMQLLINCLKQNILFVLLIWFIGCTIIGMPILYATIIYKGFCIGYTISAIIATLEFRKAITFTLLALLPQNIIIIPSILFCSVSGIKLYKHIMKDKDKNNIRIEIVRHTILSIFSLIAIIIASFIEIYISTNLLIIFKDFL